MKDQDHTSPRSKSPLEWMRWIPAVLFAGLIITLLLIGSRVILFPLLSSLALAYMLEPLVEAFEQRGWSRNLSVLATLVLSFILLILALIFVIPSLWSQLVKSYEQLPNALEAGHRILDPLIAQLKTTSPPIYEFIQSLLQKFRSPEQQAEIGATVGKWLQGGLFKLVTATSSLLDLLLIPFFVFYLLSDYHKMIARVDSWVPPRYRSTVSDLLSRISTIISAYVRNQLVIALAMGVLYALGFAILRVPLALTLGLISGLLNFIPYVGTLTGMVLAVSFSALNGAGIGRIIGILIVFVIVQTVEGYYLTPKLLGEKLNLHPLVVLLGIVVGGNLFGLVGIILAVPVIAAARVILRFLEQDIYRNSNFYRQKTIETSPDKNSLSSPEKDNHNLQNNLPA